ncbi:MAG: ATP-binding cassette domain-containing protein [Lachnospiraceae bacterium]|nr:ATP-binding cassette domain-containing protein [Lachnospiraceae bacterium]
MIEIKNLQKAFEDNVIFKDYNLTIEDGAFAVIKGNSGCGKTTLLNMIGAIEPIDDGQIIIDGLDLDVNKNRRKYFGDVVGFLFQNFALIDNKTVRQNLEIIKKKNRSEVTIEDALRRVGLSDKIDEKVYKLSGGEQQRIALARLMIKSCKLILADEPTGSLDKENARKVMEILKSLNEEGKTIVMVTHAEEYHDYGTVLVELKRE